MRTNDMKTTLWWEAPQIFTLIARLFLTLSLVPNVRKLNENGQKTLAF